jgi:hypothetical protein
MLYVLWRQAYCFLKNSTLLQTLNTLTLYIPGLFWQSSILTSYQTQNNYSKKSVIGYVL